MHLLIKIIYRLFNMKTIVSWSRTSLDNQQQLLKLILKFPYRGASVTSHTFASNFQSDVSSSLERWKRKQPQSVLSSTSCRSDHTVCVFQISLLQVCTSCKSPHPLTPALRAERTWFSSFVTRSKPQRSATFTFIHLHPLVLCNTRLDFFISQSEPGSCWSCRLFIWIIKHLSC